MTGRLIEADKAIEATWEQPTYTDPLNVLTDVRDRIKELPTVEAIPVEWLRNLQDKFYEKSEWLIVAAVGAIIEDWQKEQRKEE